MAAEQEGDHDVGGGAHRPLRVATPEEGPGATPVQPSEALAQPVEPFAMEEPPGEEEGLPSVRGGGDAQRQGCGAHQRCLAGGRAPAAASARAHLQAEGRPPYLHRGGSQGGRRPRLRALQGGGTRSGAGSRGQHGRGHGGRLARPGAQAQDASPDPLHLQRRPTPFLAAHLAQERSRSRLDLRLFLEGVVGPAGAQKYGRPQFRQVAQGDAGAAHVASRHILALRADSGGSSW